MKTRTIIALSDTPEDQRNVCSYCFYCNCPNHPKRVTAVAVVRVDIPHNTSLYFGICSTHAEVYPYTEEERKRKPMLCTLCAQQHTYQEGKDNAHH